MSPLALSSVIFVLVLGGILLGSLLRRALPEHHLSKESQDVVRLGVGLVATIGALVLGLLIASAKSSFDTKSGQVRQITADIILLDKTLSQYGSETLSIRTQLRATLAPFVDRLWHEKAASAGGPFETNVAAEKIYLEIYNLTPQNDFQRTLQSRAIQISVDLAQTRLLLFVSPDSAIPTPFLAILVFWLVIIFASFSLFSPLNTSTFVLLAVLALSASCAIFLILELSQPFEGLMQIPSAPLLNALAPLT
ncbi:MAG TPA: hypothetical protein VEE84_02950 [Burkholderiaceae bacterium]|nr:hypothetical protein [Burkholderiaceae bacterium]